MLCNPTIFLLFTYVQYATLRKAIYRSIRVIVVNNVDVN